MEKKTNILVPSFAIFAGEIMFGWKLIFFQNFFTCFLISHALSQVPTLDLTTNLASTRHSYAF
jgi:hypothetical protein